MLGSRSAVHANKARLLTRVLIICCVATAARCPQREHMTAEKNASLESLVRATAAATTQAGKLVSGEADCQYMQLLECGCQLEVYRARGGSVPRVYRRGATLLHNLGHRRLLLLCCHDGAGQDH